MKTEEQRRLEVVQQVRVLWPSLSFTERHDWVERVRNWFGGDFAETVKALSADPQETPDV